MFKHRLVKPKLYLRKYKMQHQTGISKRNALSEMTCIKFWILPWIIVEYSPQFETTFAFYIITLAVAIKRRVCCGCTGVVSNNTPWPWHSNHDWLVLRGTKAAKKTTPRRSTSSSSLYRPGPWIHAGDNKFRVHHLCISAEIKLHQSRLRYSILICPVVAAVRLLQPHISADRRGTLLLLL